MASSTSRMAWLPAFTAALPLFILFVTALSIPLAASQNLGLTAEQTSSWILVLWGLPGILGLILTYLYKQPILLTGSIFAMIFVSTLGSQIPFDELAGAFMVSGVIVALITVLGLTQRLADLIPAAIVFGLLAAAVLPFVTGVFNAFGEYPIIAGGTFLAYLAGRRALAGIPPIVPALIVGLILAAIRGAIGSVPEDLSLSALVLSAPVFSVNGIVSVVPIVIVLITLQANVPSLIFLQSEGYQPPERVVSGVSAVSTIIGSFFGPVAISLSLPATSFVAGSAAGDRATRHHAAYIASGALLLIGILAGFAAAIPQIVPLPLLLMLAGLSIIDVFTQAIQQVVRGPLILGPILAFTVALSEMSLFGLGPFFWALVIGTAVSRLLESNKPEPGSTG